MSKRARFVLCSSSALVFGVGGWLALTSVSHWSSKPNVILISLDTTRADRLSCYGYPDATTPNLDKFAQDSVLFSNAITPVPLTMPAHCSMMTGLLPLAHGVHGNIDYRLPASAETLAERLKKQGYKTGAVVGAMVLSADSGISQGFDDYDDRVSKPGLVIQERKAEEVTQLAEAWLERNGTDPFFLFLHYHDAHDPYQAPEPFASRFPDDPYAAEIAYTDHNVGRFLQTLRKRGLYDSSIVIVVGDHGESLGEHGEQKHGFFIYRSTTRVPMLIKPAGSLVARRTKAPASLIDIVPTVFSLLGIPATPDLQGRDLSELFAENADEFPQRRLYVESLIPTKYGRASLFSLEIDGWKYIRAPRPELYHVAVDPREQYDLIGQEATWAEFLRLHLDLIVNSAVAPNTGVVKSEDLRLAQLSSLGYTGCSVSENVTVDTNSANPKDFIAIYTNFEQMESLLYRNNYSAARAIGEKVLHEHEAEFDLNGLVELHQWMGQLAIKEGNEDAAAEHFDWLIQADPESPDAPGWHNNLGILYSNSGKLDQAKWHYEQALASIQRQMTHLRFMDRSAVEASDILDVTFSVRLNLGNIQARQGEFDAAVDQYFQALQVNPAHAAVRVSLGTALLELGRYDDAIGELRTAIRLDPNYVPARSELDTAVKKKRDATM